MVNVLYDTNGLYYPKTLRRLAARGDVTLWGANVHVVETVSDIRDEKSFWQARSQMRLMLEVSPKHFLPDADTLFRMAMGLKSDEKNVRQWRQVAQILAATESYDKLTLNVEAVRRQRDQHAQRYLEPVLTKMVPSIQPKAVTDPERFNLRLGPADLATFREALFSDDGRRALTNGWIAQRVSDLVLPEHLWNRAHEVLQVYYLTYRGFWVNVFERNLKPTANDALDLDLTLALWPQDWMFLTADRKLLDGMTTGGVPPQKFADIRTFDPDSWSDGRSA